MPKRRANGEGSIYAQKKDKNGKVVMWASSYIDNAGIRRTLYGKTQQEVREKLKTAIKASDDGLKVDKSKILFSDWMKEWLEVYKKPFIREVSYVRNYTTIYNHIIPAFPDVLIKDLSVDMLQKFINSKVIGGRLDKKKDIETGKIVARLDGLSLETIIRMNNIIKQALNQAVDNGMLLTNVANKVKLPDVSQKAEVKILSLDEQKRLETTLHNYTNPNKLFIFMSLYTGMRRGELMGLNIDDINLYKKELYVRKTRGIMEDIHKKGGSKKFVNEPKTPKSRRTIPLPDFIVEMIKEYMKYRNELVNASKEYWSYCMGGNEWVDKGFLFLSHTGTAISSSSLRKMFEKTLRDSGLDHIKIHALRHTFTTRCIENGFDVKTLSEILGHTNVKTTLGIYAHSMEEQKRLNMDKLKPLTENDPEKE